MNLLEAQELAKKLLHEHGIHDWKFCFDRAKMRFGSCRYSIKTITLSKILTELNTPTVVKNVILHEIAHALVEKKCGHGKKWKEKVLEIGGIPSRCFSSQEVQMPLQKYTAVCPSCSTSFQVQKKQKGACKKCCTHHNKGKYSEKFLLLFQQNNIVTKNPKKSRPRKKTKKTLIKNGIQKLFSLFFPF